MKKTDHKQQKILLDYIAHKATGEELVAYYQILLALFANKRRAHLLLAYIDSYSRLLIARRLFDNITPGLAQLGGVWLPLPHILMLPLPCTMSINRQALPRLILKSFQP